MNDMFLSESAKGRSTWLWLKAWLSQPHQAAKGALQDQLQLVLASVGSVASCLLCGLVAGL
eukprot:353320-Chlamydomonas_euryale.AAC.6